MVREKKNRYEFLYRISQRKIEKNQENSMLLCSIEVLLSLFYFFNNISMSSKKCVNQRTLGTMWSNAPRGVKRFFEMEAGENEDLPRSNCRRLDDSDDDEEVDDSEDTDDRDFIAPEGTPSSDEEVVVVKKRRVVLESDDDEGVEETKHGETEPPASAVPPVTPVKKTTVDVIDSSTLRRFILITLDHVEQQEATLTLEEVASRVMSTFDVLHGVVAREEHKEGGYHYHCAVENTSASKNTAAKKMRSVFPYFKGRMTDVKFHKCFITPAAYVVKEDKELANVYVFPESFTKEDLRKMLDGKRSKTELCVEAMRDHVLAGLPNETLVSNAAVVPFMLRNVNSVLTVANMMRAAPSVDSRDTKTRIMDAAGGEAPSADVLDMLSSPQRHCLKELMKQLQGRVPRQRQLYCLGPSGTGKTFLFEQLARHTRCFVPCLENGDRMFAGYSDLKHDWIFINDFCDSVNFQMLSNILEGSTMMLNGYGQQLLKVRNVPVVITANELPLYPKLSDARRNALLNRLKVVNFSVEFDTAVEPPSFTEIARVLMKLAAEDA